MLTQDGRVQLIHTHSAPLNLQHASQLADIAAHTAENSIAMIRDDEVGWIARFAA
jgi:hypothetical protein